MIRAMRLRWLGAVLAVTVALPFDSVAQDSKNRGSAYPPSFPEATAEVYKTVGDVKLNLYVFLPDGHQPTDTRPAIVFFFGGGWRSGNPRQFYEHCKHLSGLGLVAITADYRVASRHDVKAVSCVADAKSAIRHVRKNAKRMGIDPDRIVAAGGSAGGHIAACTAVIDGFDEVGEEQAISGVPNALVLFNPALVLAPIEGVDLLQGRVASLADRMGTEPQRLSPIHHVKRGVPPTLILHGKADTTVPYASAEAFAQAMTAAGNTCKLIGYEGQPHGFFNFGRGDGTHYKKTVQAMDAFLMRLGYLTSM